VTRAATWVLVADGARARLLSVDGPIANLMVTEQHTFEATHSPNRELQRDKPARVFDSVGAGRHAIESRKDPHRNLKLDFAKELACVLEALKSQKAFERLVVVAPPATLGDLRRVLSDDVKDVVTAEAALDLTRVPLSEIGRHIERIIGPKR
jgi:protein required for attachment to host cells